VKEREERTSGGEEGLLSGQALRVGAGGEAIWRDELHLLPASMQHKIKRLEEHEGIRAIRTRGGRAPSQKVVVRRLEVGGSKLIAAVAGDLGL
jgi:hypothetical protein